MERKALGEISNININAINLGGAATTSNKIFNPTLIANNPLKPIVSYNKLLDPCMINDENDSSKANAFLATNQSNNKFEFEYESFKVPANDKKIVFNVYEEEEESDKEEEDEDEELVTENFDEDEETEDDDEEDDDVNNELDEEEEGISRLNLESMNENENSVALMDESTSNDSLANSSLNSNMKMDNSSKLTYSAFEEEEQSEDIETDFNDCDEERIRKQAAIERDNVLMNCSEYVDDIITYMRKLEMDHRAEASYMKKQQDITSPMRSILIDWLVEVSEEYNLNLETLYLAVNYTDRFLSCMSVLRSKLQLVGTASMYIASKYEEITPPDISEFVYITDDTYTKKQLLRMEHLLLKTLSFHMSPPTINWFLMFYWRSLKVNLNLTNQRAEHLSHFLAELSLIDGETFLAYLPSQVAASAIYLALSTLGKPWTKQIAEILGYNYDLKQLKGCIIELNHAMKQAPTHPQQAVYNKYKQEKYNYVSLIEPAASLNL